MRVIVSLASVCTVAMADQQEIVIESVVSIKGGDLKGRVVIPPKHIKHICDTTFIHLSTVPNFSAVLFGPGRCNVSKNNRERLLSRTDVADRLTTLRNTKIHDITTDIVKQCAPKKKLDMFGDSSGQTGTTYKRMTMAQRVAVPDTVTIEAPSFGDVVGRSMVVLAKNKRGPLFIECSGPNIQYVRDACSFQIRSGTVKRHATPKTACTKMKRRSIVNARYNNPTIDTTDVDMEPITTHKPAFEDTPSPMCKVPTTTPIKSTSARSGSITDFFQRV